MNLSTGGTGIRLRYIKIPWFRPPPSSCCSEYPNRSSSHEKSPLTHPTSTTAGRQPCQVGTQPERSEVSGHERHDAGFILHFGFLVWFSPWLGYCSFCRIVLAHSQTPKQKKWDRIWTLSERGKVIGPRDMLFGGCLLLANEPRAKQPRWRWYSGWEFETCSDNSTSEIIWPNYSDLARPHLKM